MTSKRDVAHEINDFVADATDDQIVDLIADGTMKRETVLARFNARELANPPNGASCAPIWTPSGIL